MSLVFLVYGAALFRVLFLILLGDLKGIVLRGSVVNDQDLHIIPARQK
jgi:hypothetical protein